MNREILFRGKRLSDEAWVEGDLSRCVVVGETHIRRIEDNLSTTTHKVDPSTVCQYTGLTDREGRKIFEGDIIKHFNDGLNPMKFKIAVVKWSGEGCVYVQQNSLGMEWRIYGRYSECYEVIGNIFDNPDLLKE